MDRHTLIIHNTPSWLSIISCHTIRFAASLKTLLGKTRWEKTIAKGKRVQPVCSPSDD